MIYDYLIFVKNHITKIDSLLIERSILGGVSLVSYQFPSVDVSEYFVGRVGKDFIFKWKQFIFKWDESLTFTLPDLTIPSFFFFSVFPSIGKKKVYFLLWGISSLYAKVEQQNKPSGTITGFQLVTTQIIFFHQNQHPLLILFPCSLPTVILN